MTFKVYLQPDAEMDIEDAANWYEFQQKGLGGGFLDEMLRAFKKIADNPFIYAVVYRETRRALIRRFPFAVYYRIEEDSIIVIAVMHGSRHPKRWQKRI